MRTVLALLLIGALSSACGAATPCDGVDVSMSREQQDVWSNAVAHQMGLPSVQLLKAFRLGGWGIIYVDTQQSDEVYLFYPTDPTKSTFVTMWSGAARVDEEAEIKNWVLKNAPHIPDGLAACFAWEVTKHRAM